MNDEIDSAKLKIVLEERTSLDFNERDRET